MIIISNPINLADILSGILFTSRCSVYLSADQPIPTDVWTKILFNVALYDNDSEFDLVTNYRFIAEKSGVYHVSCLLHYLTIAQGTVVQVSIRKNGATTKQRGICHYAEVNEYAGVSGDIPLAEGDYLEAFAMHDNGNTQDVSNVLYRTYFDIHRFA